MWFSLTRLFSGAGKGAAIVRGYQLGNTGRKDRAGYLSEGGFFAAHCKIYGGAGW